RGLRSDARGSATLLWRGRDGGASWRGAGVFRSRKAARTGRLSAVCIDAASAQEPRTASAGAREGCGSAAAGDRRTTRLFRGAIGKDRRQPRTIDGLGSARRIIRALSPRARVHLSVYL